MKRTPMNQTNTQAMSSADSSYLDLAGAAVLAGMTREQVLAQLVSRIRRDQGYLAYRRASGRKTRYDDQVASDLQAIALAICWLQEARNAFPTRASTSDVAPQAHR
jgi:hypothetical protein